MPVMAQSQNNFVTHWGPKCWEIWRKRLVCLQYQPDRGTRTMNLYLTQVIIFCILHPHQNRIDRENLLVVFSTGVSSSGPHSPRPAALMRTDHVFHRTWKVNAIMYLTALLSQTWAARLTSGEPGDNCGSQLSWNTYRNRVTRNNGVGLQITGIWVALSRRLIAWRWVQNYFLKIVLFCSIIVFNI